ncbi:MAG: hypothetical protein ACOY3I_07850 [Verrucomicrobiota bacterium]
MEWNIKERAEQCAVTNKPFEEGEIFYTILFQEAGKLVRQDLCSSAWEQRKTDQPPVSFWRSAFKPTPIEPEPIEHNSAEAELRRLLLENSHNNEKLPYLLALLLERKKIFHERERATLNDKKVVIYEHVETQETFVVPRVDIKLDEINALQQELKNSSPIFA